MDRATLHMMGEQNNFKMFSYCAPIQSRPEIVQCSAVSQDGQLSNNDGPTVIEQPEDINGVQPFTQR